MTVSPTWMEVEVDPEEAETKVGEAFKLKVELFASVKVSIKVKPVKSRLPVGLLASLTGLGFTLDSLNSHSLENFYDK